MEYILRSLADCYQSVSLSLLLSGVPLPALKPAEEFAVNHRRFKAIKQVKSIFMLHVSSAASCICARVAHQAPVSQQLRHAHVQRSPQLGEGGYAIVYLVKEVPTPEQPLVEPMPYALKKVGRAFISPHAITQDAHKDAAAAQCSIECCVLPGTQACDSCSSLSICTQCRCQQTHAQHYMLGCQCTNASSYTHATPAHHVHNMQALHCWHCNPSTYHHPS